jgi:hypothetical protein
MPIPIRCHCMKVTRVFNPRLEGRQIPPATLNPPPGFGGIPTGVGLDIGLNLLRQVGGRRRTSITPKDANPATPATFASTPPAP